MVNNGGHEEYVGEKSVSCHALNRCMMDFSRQCSHSIALIGTYIVISRLLNRYM